MNQYYFETVPVFTRGLKGLRTVLTKSKEHLATTGGDEAAFVNAQLISDMFPFKKQIQVATDNAKGAVARFSSQEIPSFPDMEETLDELITRVDKTLAFVAHASEESYAQADKATFQTKFIPGKFLNADDYLREYALPNFYFHTTIAYGIARMQGVVLGKTDFLQELSLQDLETSEA